MPLLRPAHGSSRTYRAGDNGLSGSLVPVTSEVIIHHQAFQIPSLNPSVSYEIWFGGCSTGNLNSGTRQKMVSENQIGAKNKGENRSGSAREGEERGLGRTLNWRILMVEEKGARG